MEVGGNSLGKLMQFRREKKVPQLGLSDQGSAAEFEICPR